MFEGVMTALVTPFKNGRIDEPGLRLLVEDQIDAGIHGLVPCGSTGESATLSHEEHRQVVELVVDAANGRVPVVAGTGSNNTREAIELTQYAKEAGASAALLISPYYNKPTQAGIVEHYAAVAKATALPLLVYNIAGRTGSNITAETQSELASIEYIVGVKEASGDIGQISDVVRSCPADFAVLSGDDAMALPLMAVGGKGVISTSSNVVPREMLEIVAACNAGDYSRAREIHFRLTPIFEALFCETNPIPVKAALAMQGKISDEIRLPMTKITEAGAAHVRGALSDLGLLS
ncbi:MAG: 4-hydroxy-tetrahydrodipicolinate synthase [Myxococcota bacterium]|nr:4-hydroxy-tetrahydrodipicolinate synthase [Myxococcota bacterium]